MLPFHLGIFGICFGYGVIDLGNVGIVFVYAGIKGHYGDIKPHYGDIKPHYGDINPHYDDLNPPYDVMDPRSSAGSGTSGNQSAGQLVTWN